MDSNSNGNGRRRLPDYIDDQFLDLQLRQLWIQGEASGIFDSLDSDTARYLQAHFQAIIDFSEETQAMLKSLSDDLKDEFKKIREQQRCNTH